MRAHPHERMHACGVLVSGLDALWSLVSCRVQTNSAMAAYADGPMQVAATMEAACKLHLPHVQQGPGSARITLVLSGAEGSCGVCFSSGRKQTSAERSHESLVTSAEPPVCCL